jgi:serine phosphatase RsbU (regulator of sigma subunit)
VESGVFRVQGGDELLVLVRALVAAPTVEEVAATVAEHAAAALGAPFSNLAVFDPQTNMVRVAHGAFLDPGIAARWAEFPISAPTPLCEAILTGAPVLLGSLDAVAARYPEVADDARTVALPALASVPLLSPTGTLGALGVAWSEPQELGPDQVRSLQAVADLAAEVLYRAIRHQQDEQRYGTVQAVAAELLQRAFLPTELPHTDRLDVAAAYLPAAGAVMGGDWYDLFPVGGGRTCLVIGDVVGHGVDAVASMAELRNAIRAYAAEDPAPGRVLARANRMLCRLGTGTTASAIVALWDPGTRTLARANAGHPPVLRCRPGEFGFLWPPQNVLLGVVPGLRYRQETKVLRPGTTMVLFTDGLVEARAQPVEETMRRLLEFVERLDDLSPQAVCDSIVEWRRSLGPRTDDTCVVAARLA